VTDFAALIGRLSDAEVEFILIGGVAATVHGSVRLTRDVDIVYPRNPANIRKICDAFSAVHPYLRGASKGLPFRLDPPTMTAGLNFTLTTDEGDLGLLGEMTGGGTYEQLLPNAVRIELYGRMCACLSVDQLIAAKRAAGRPRDLDAIAELEIIRDRSGRKSNRSEEPS
jgi:predicted nucleotidyltransferase